MSHQPEKLIEVAQSFLEYHFPNASTAFLAGSFVRGEGTSTSDLDLVILSEHPDIPYRESFIFKGYPIETFVHNPLSLKQFFQQDCQRKRPSLPGMCWEGWVLKDTLNLATEIKKEAEQLLKKGPPPLSPEEALSYRYHLTDLLEDLKGSQVTLEDYFIVPTLMSQLIEYYLLYHGQWIGSGKWHVRALRIFDAPKADNLEKVLDKYYQSQNATGIILLAEDWLSQMGGLLFEGYKAKAPKK